MSTEKVISRDACKNLRKYYGGENLDRQKITTHGILKSSGVKYI